MTLDLVYLEVLVIAVHFDNIIFCHDSKILNIFFEYDSGHFRGEY